MKVKKFVFKFLDSDSKTAKNIIIKVISVDAYQWKENESEMKKDENWKKEKFQKLCEWKSKKDYEIYKGVCRIVQDKLGANIFTEYKLASEEKYSKDKLINLNISKDTKDKLIRENYCGMKKVLTFIKGSYKATENCLEDWTAMYDNERTDWHFTYKCEYENDAISLVEIPNTSYELKDVNKVKEWKKEEKEQISLTSPIEESYKLPQEIIKTKIEGYNENSQKDIFSGGYGCACNKSSIDNKGGYSCPCSDDQKGAASSSSSSSSASSEQDGGYGIKGQGKGRKQSKLQREHESIAHKGKKQSKLQREHESAAHKGKPHPHKGVKENAQWRANISKGERASYERRYGVKKGSKKSTGSKRSSAKTTRSKQSGGFGVPGMKEPKRGPQSPEHKEHESEAHKGKHEDEQWRHNISLGEKKSYEERYGHPPEHHKSEQEGGKDKYLKYKTKYLNLKNSLF